MTDWLFGSRIRAGRQVGGAHVGTVRYCPPLPLESFRRQISRCRPITAGGYGQDRRAGSGQVRSGEDGRRTAHAAS